MVLHFSSSFSCRRLPFLVPPWSSAAAARRVGAAMTGLHDAAANLVLSLELAEQELQTVSHRLADEFSRRQTVCAGVLACGLL